MEQLVFLNGSLLPRSKAFISPLDFGFLYGYGLFETMRAYSGRIFRLERHLQRLRASMGALAIPDPSFDLEKACRAILEANNLTDARIRLTVSLGDSEGGPDPPAQPNLTIFAMATAYSPPPERVYAKGYRAITSAVRRHSGSPLSSLKSLNYLENLLARSEARQAGFDEAIVLNERGFLCEGSTTNLFLVTGSALLTPAVANGCLPGITRGAVMELARALDVPVFERALSPADLSAAGEAFLTNSLLEIMPLTEVDGETVGGIEGKGAGKITGRLMQAYRALVAREGVSLP